MPLNVELSQIKSLTAQIQYIFRICFVAQFYLKWIHGVTEQQEFKNQLLGAN